MGSCSAQFPMELRTSKPSPRVLHPSTQQNMPVQSPTAEVRFPPLRDTGRGFSQLGVGGLCCSLSSPSCHPGTADKGQAFASMATRPLPAQQQKAQQHKNSLTQKEKGPHFLLVPPTDRLHSLQTYNNTKTTPMLPNFRKMDVVA